MLACVDSFARNKLVNALALVLSPRARGYVRVDRAEGREKNG